MKERVEMRKEKKKENKAADVYVRKGTWKDNGKEMGKAEEQDAWV